jgi:hypothetical protein
VNLREFLRGHRRNARMLSVMCVSCPFSDWCNAPTADCAEAVPKVINIKPQPKMAANQ